VGWRFENATIMESREGMRSRDCFVAQGHNEAVTAARDIVVIASRTTRESLLTASPVKLSEVTEPRATPPSPA
jgi:hypothetical protein